MATVLHRTTKRLLRSVNTPDYSVDDWIVNPDLSAVAGQPARYWAITGDVVSLMDQAARDQVDADVAQAATDADRTAEKARLTTERVLRAFALVVMDEINLLRAQHGLADRTASRLLNAITAKVDTI